MIGAFMLILTIKRRYLQLLLACFLFIISCVPTRDNVEDKEWLEARLRKRINDFYISFITNKPKILWELNSESFKKGEDKEKYIEYVKKRNFVAEYYKTDFFIEKIEIREKRAKVKIKLSIKFDKDSNIDESFVYDYWTFENNDWFIAHASSTSKSRVGWW
jgi:hypothetical protein